MHLSTYILYMYVYIYIYGGIPYVSDYMHVPSAVVKHKYVGQSSINGTIYQCSIAM